MEPWVNYHHLLYFKVIAEEGSIARAAEHLRLGQPTLSAQLKTLEEHLGMPLFDREHKRLTLNEQGRIAFQYAKEIFRLGSEMVDALRDRKTPKRIQVQLGALDSIPKQLLYRWVDAAYRIQSCSVSVLEGHDDELLGELLSHRIDLLMSNHRPAVSGGEKIFARSIGKLPVSIFVSPEHRRLRRGFPKSLEGEPIVLPTMHSKLRQDVDHFFGSREIQPEVVAETQDTSLQKLLGARGVGAIPIPELAVEDLVKKGELVSLGRLEGVYEEIFLVSSTRKIENPVASRLFREFSFE
jgi:LysR family transcriptional activator of nhaA